MTQDSPYVNNNKKCVGRISRVLIEIPIFSYLTMLWFLERTNSRLEIRYYSIQTLPLFAKESGQIYPSFFDRASLLWYKMTRKVEITLYFGEWMFCTSSNSRDKGALSRDVDKQIVSAKIRIYVLVLPFSTRLGFPWKPSSECYVLFRVLKQDSLPYINWLTLDGEFVITD